jgi:hypothetical protein
VTLALELLTVRAFANELAVNVQVVADSVVAVVCVIAADAPRAVIVEPVINKLAELIIAGPGVIVPPRIIELLTLTMPALLRMQGEFEYAPFSVQLVRVEVPPATVRTSVWSRFVAAFSTQFDNE